jgi:GDP-L-fucose synthase
MDKGSLIFVAGHKGLVGSAICRRLRAAGCHNLLLRTRDELDLRDSSRVEEFFRSHRPEYVFLAAAKVGGIQANSSWPADFLLDNLNIQNNVISSASRYEVKKLAFLGSSCIYPKLAPQPLREEYLLTGGLEPTNEWYAIAKIAGIKLAQACRRQYGLNAISLMPTNLYGPGDNFDLESSHVLPALLRKAQEAIESGSQELVAWGSGNPLREFLHVDDLADAALFLMLHYNEPDIINVGTGSDLTIRELAAMILRITGCTSRLVFDSSKPDGTPRKLLDISRLTALGWKARIPLEQGIAETYRWYLNSLSGSDLLCPGGAAFAPERTELSDP